MSQRILFAAFSTALLLTACSNDPLDIDTRNVTVDIGFTNLDSILVNTDTAKLLGAIMDQRVKMPEVIDYEIGYCLNIGRVTDPGMVSRLHQFRTEGYVKRLEQRIHEHFPDLAARNAKINDGFRHLKAHLPDVKLPKNIAYVNSYFASSAFCTEDAIAIGLERYLGPKTDVIAELPSQDFYGWIKEGMDEQYLERDAVAAWIMTHVTDELNSPMTIEAIINWGKILYLTEAAFPDLPKHLIVRYNELDYKWALENERAFWDYLVKNKLLFQRDEQLQMSLLKEGPFTPGLPEKGPDRLGQFLGWRILQSYMEQYDVTLQQLMAVPYTELLQEYEIDD